MISPIAKLVHMYTFTVMHGYNDIPFGRISAAYTPIPSYVMEDGEK